jgi:hypothetical protein
MAIPTQTTGLGVAAKIVAPGNVNGTNTTPGYNTVALSLTGTNTFQLVPLVQDAAGNTVSTPLVLTAVAASTPGALVLSAAAAAGVYTGTITGGGSNAFAGLTFVVAGFVTTTNNGTFVCTASTTTTLTLANIASAAETHAGTATATTGTAIYTGTITGGGTNALAGIPFTVAGFAGSNNNGSFIATASSATTLTLTNGAATAETHAGTVTPTAGAGTLTYVEYGFRSLASGTAGKLPASANGTAIATVSSTGLITGVTQGGTVVEISYPAFNNTVGNVSSSGNIMNGLPINKIYAEVNVTVGP